MITGAANISLSKSLFIILPSKLVTNKKWFIKQLITAPFG